VLHGEASRTSHTVPFQPGAHAQLVDHTPAVPRWGWHWPWPEQLPGQPPSSSTPGTERRCCCDRGAAR
jgi:hypothetical protein